MSITAEHGQDHCRTAANRMNFGRAEMIQTRVTTTVITTALAIAMVACSAHTDPRVPMKNTITQRQAIERVDQYIHDAVAAITPPVRLEVLSGSDDSACDDPTDNGPKGRISASRDYWLHDLPAEKHNDYIDALKRWWQEHDFVVLRDDRPRDIYVTAENRHDGFRMGIEGTVTGPPRLSIGASSPCVWPNGTPAPRTP
jgi:hypothetical protein